jgi:hypothetical protein
MRAIRPFLSVRLPSQPAAAFDRLKPWLYLTFGIEGGDKVTAAALITAMTMPSSDMALPIFTNA